MPVVVLRAEDIPLRGAPWLSLWGTNLVEAKFEGHNNPPPRRILRCSSPCSEKAQRLLLNNIEDIDEDIVNA
jgi:hypothetical protein